MWIRTVNGIEFIPIKKTIQGLIITAKEAIK